MRNQFVNKKSELTTKLNEYASTTCEVLRSRMACQCQLPSPRNKRYGIVAIVNNTVIAKVIRCKACTKANTY